MTQLLRASEIGMYTYCAKSYLLLKAGVSPQQTLQDLITEKKIPPVVVIQLQQKNIPLNTTVDKVIGQGLLPPKVEKEIIQNNIMLQGIAKHEDIGKQTQQGSMVAEHRGGYLLVLLIILIIIGFLVMILLQQGGIP